MKKQQFVLTLVQPIQLLIKILQQHGVEFEDKSMEMTLVDGHTQNTKVLTATVNIIVQGELIPTELIVLEYTRGNKIILDIDILTAAGIVLNFQRRQWYFTETSRKKYNFVKASPNIKALFTVNNKLHPC